MRNSPNGVDVHRPSSAPPAVARIAPQLACTQRARDYSRQSFAELRLRVISENEPYVLASAEMPHEIFDTIGLPVITFEWWGGIISAKKMAGSYLSWANAQGFHQGLGAYNTLGLVSLMADLKNPPWGGLPRPALICAPHREQSSERVGSMVAAKLGVPYFGIEIPASSVFHPNWWELARHEWEMLHETRRIDIVLEQYSELIRVATHISGKEMNIESLRQKVMLVNQQEEYFDEARNLIASARRCPVRLSEQMSNAMTAQWHRGTDWATNHARSFRDEIAERVSAGAAVINNERTRLMWIGVGLWQNTEFYSSFEDAGAVFVWSMYLALAADAYIKYGLTDPVRALAARYCNLGELAHAPPWAGAWVVSEAKKHRIDAAVMLTSPGQHHQLAGNLFQKDALENAGIPVLELTADPNDNRTWDELSLRRQVMDFLKERFGQ